MLDLWLSLRKSDKTMIWQENLLKVQVHLKLRNLYGLSNSKIKININKKKRFEADLVFCSTSVLNSLSTCIKTHKIKRKSTRNFDLSIVFARDMGVDHSKVGTN